MTLSSLFRIIILLLIIADFYVFMKNLNVYTLFIQYLKTYKLFKIKYLISGINFHSCPIFFNYIRKNIQMHENP